MRKYIIGIAMISGIYAATSGMIAVMEQQEVLANNMANINASGYQERQVIFSANNNINFNTIFTGTKIAMIHKNDNVGSLSKTDNPLDLAIAEANRYFVLLGTTGQLLTRCGEFTISASGILTDLNGFPVLGENGVIKMPPGANNILISDDGTIIADGDRVAKLRIAAVLNTDDVQSIGLNTFRTEETNLQYVQTRVLQGYKESSNVDANKTIVHLLYGMRLYESIQRVLRSIYEVTQINVRTNI